MPNPRDEALEIRVPIEDLIQALSDPAALGVEGPVQVIQTHVSAVFLGGDRAYKVKKPIQLWGFLDYGSVAMRRHWCDVEVALNRRLAPDIYAGVAPIVRLADGSLRVGEVGDEDAENVVEHAVVMERLPEGVTFLERLEAGVLTEADLIEAAGVLADFHKRAAMTPEEATLARPSSFGGIVRQNFLSTREGIGDLFPASVHEGLSNRIADRLRRTREVVRRRLAEGRMVNGHGDVRLEHVIRHDGRVQVIDCVEFSDMVRHVDPLCDMAFLSMDLAERGRWDLAALLEAAYIDAAGEDPDEAALLLPLYRSYRAHVRAKVDQQTAASPEVPAALREAKRLGARRFLALARTYAGADDVPPMIVMRGTSGTGKSVLATHLAPWLGAEVIRSDLVRKELAGIAPTERLDASGNEDLYSSDMSRRTYDEVLRRAVAAVSDGHAAILDATYLRADARERVRSAAERLGAPFAILDVQCEDAVIRDRLARRSAAGTDASDADVAIYESQIAEAEPMGADEAPFVVPVASDEEPELAVLALLDVLERQRA